MPLLLAIDQSTSATKVILFQPDGTVIDREAMEHRQMFPRPGWVEHDAKEIWENLITVSRALLERQAARRDDIAGVSIANQRETFVVFDRDTGEPLRPAIVWQCRRGDPLCREQSERGREEAMRRKTGLRLDSYFTAPKLQWLLREEPGLRSRLEAGKAGIGTIDTYLVHRLTGGAVYATDPTNACRTLLFGLRTRQWDEELCRWWEVPRSALPEIRDSSAQFGTTTLAGLLPKAVPICGVMGDSQASFFAHRCFEAGTAKVTFGSGSSVLLNLGIELPADDTASVLTLAWVHQGQPTYAAEGLIISSGSTIAWLRDQLGLVATSAETEAIARSVTDNGGVYLVPAFSGLGAPYWADDARGAIIGLTAHSDRRHLVRAGLESIGYQLRDVLKEMQNETGVRIDRLHADGGATANAFLMQFTADVVETDLAVAPDPNLSALGAMWMGALGLGLHADLAALQRLPRAAVMYRRFHDTATIDRLVAGWQRAVAQVLLRQ